MLTFGRIKNLMPFLPADLNVPEEAEVKITSAESLFGVVPDQYQYSSSIFDRFDGHTIARVAVKGRWLPLQIGYSWSTGSGESGATTVPSIGEQIADWGRVDFILLYYKYRADGEDNEDVLTIGIGGVSSRRYLKWRMVETAKEIFGSVAALDIKDHADRVLSLK